MKIKSKPKPPVRKTVDYSIELYADPVISEIESLVKDRLKTLFGYDDEELKLVTTDDMRLENLWGYHDEVELVVVFTLPEPNVQWSTRVARYKKRLVEYGEWYDANRDAIEKELAEREAKRVLDAKAEVKSKINQLEAKLAKLKSKR